MSGCCVQPLLCYAVCLSAVWVIFVHQAVCCCWLPPTAPYLLVWRGEILLLPRNLEDKSLKILGRKPLALNHYYVWPQPNVQSEARVSTLDPSRSRRQRGTSALVSKWSSQEVNELWPGQERGADDYSQYQVDTGLAPPQHPHQHNLDCAASIKLTQLLHSSDPELRLLLLGWPISVHTEIPWVWTISVYVWQVVHYLGAPLLMSLKVGCHFSGKKTTTNAKKTLQSTTCPTHSKLMKEETPVVWTLQISAIRGEYSPCWVSPNTTCVQCGHTRGCFYKQCTTSGREGQATTTQFPPWGNECMLCWRG